MPINTLAYATLFQQKADEQMVAQATSGWMESNSGQVKYNGGSEVKIPRMTMQGLGDYDRDDGFAQGSITLDYQTFTLTQDRGRTFQLDAMDVDETNFVATAASAMAQFQREMVIPEVDSYRYSKIYSLADAAGRVNAAGYAPEATNILAMLKEDVTSIQDVVGETAQLVIVMNALCAAVLDQADKVTRTLSVTDFAQGGVQTRVTSLDTLPILRVPSARMKTAYDSFDGLTEGQKVGGLKPGADAKQINWIIVPRTTPIAISKTEKIRIFAPDVNQKADAWKIDYRKYHDLWIPERRLAQVRVNIGV